MGLAALELNDSGLTLRWAEGRSLAGPEPSPACALLEGGVLHVGAAAAARSRLLPRAVHDRFWSELGTGPLPRPFPEHLRAADLAHRHLAELTAAGAGRRLLVAVPGSYTAGQLGLLLGIAGSLDLEVVGLVDSAVAACSEAAGAERTVHVDLELHRAVVTELSGEGGGVRRSVRVLRGAGSAALREAWARRVSALYVERTRFEPRAAAASEQALWDLLPGLARALCEEGAREVRLPSASGDRILEIAASDLRAPAAGVIGRVRDCVAGLLPARVLVSDRAASVPGLLPALADAAGTAPARLPPDAAVAGALRAGDSLLTDDEELTLHVRLPFRDEP